MNTLLKKELGAHRSLVNEADECFVLKKFAYESHDDLQYSIIIPVYNQEGIIAKNLKSVLEHTLDSFEVIIILDACTDNSEKEILSFLQMYEPITPLLVSITIVKQPNTPIFETSCDNVGFILSKGRYCIDVQADMEMTEKGYNLVLQRPFELLPDCIAVSGRCAHNMFRPGGIGKLTGDALMKDYRELEVSQDYFYQYETCNRGPLIFDRKKLKELNYLDEKNYFLNNSEHDLFARAFLTKNYICGYAPIDFKSPLEVGSTRKKRDKINERYMKKRRKQSVWRRDKDTLGGGAINRYKEHWSDAEPIVHHVGHIDLKPKYS